MAKSNIGGLWATIGIEPDKNSFDTSQKLVGGLTDSFNKLIGTARNAAVVVAAQKAITGAIDEAGQELQKLHTAEQLGTTAEKLNVWRAAAKIAGADANSLVASMSKIADVQARLRWDAGGLEAFQNKLSRLRISYKEIKELSSDEALKYIFQKAETMKGEMTNAEIASALEDIGGSGAADLFLELQRQGKTFNEFFAGAASTQYQTNKGMEDAANFATEISTLGTTLTSIKDSIGNNIAGVLLEPVKSINKWLTDNKEKITNGIDKIGTATEKLVSKIGDWWEKNGDTMLGVLQNIANGVMLVIGTLTSEKGKGFFGAIWDSIKNAGKSAKELGKDAWDGNWEKFFYDYLNSFEEVFIDPGKKALGLKDGIVKSDGTVIPIAPDDWVFAARDVSDMAKAFIPQGAASVNAPAEYSIVQNFTITGSNDIPQVIKQQAYRGTQEGLLAVLDQSSRRLQMMSGTR